MINSDNLADQILNYAKSFADILIYEKEHGDITGFDNSRIKTTIQQARKIRFQLIQNPGLLIYIQDENKRNIFETDIEFIWGKLEDDISDYNDIYYEILNDPEGMSEFYGMDEEILVDFSEVLLSINGMYLHRANKLRPTFISVKPQNSEFESLYQEAMKTWLFGLNIAAVNLCWALIENLFREKLTAVNKIAELYYKKNFLRNLIDKVYEENFIDKDNMKTAHRIRYLRNLATHELKKISDDEIYKIIQQTKDIAGNILKSNY